MNQHFFAGAQTSNLSRSFSIYALENASKCDQIWDRDNARFTECFLPVVSATPAGIALCVILVQIVEILSRNLARPRWLQPFVQEPMEPAEYLNFKVVNPSHRLLLALFISSACGLILQLLAVFSPSFTVPATYPLLAWMCCVVSLTLRRPLTAPISILAVYVTLAASQAIVLVERHSMLNYKYTPTILALLASICCSGIVLCMPLRPPSLPNDKISQVFTKPTVRLRSPEDNLKLWHFLTASWMSSLVSLGYKRTLQAEDVWTLSYEFQHTALHQTFRELGGTVFRRILRANGSDLLLITFLALFEEVCILSAPALLQQLLRSMENSDTPKSSAITYAGLLLLARLAASQAAVLDLWFSRRAYERCRGEVITMIYEKTLTRKIVRAQKESGKDPTDIAKQKKQPASMGKVLNLMRFDTYEIAQRFWDFNIMIIQPTAVILSIVLIWQLIGWPCLIGVLVLIIAQFANAFVTRALFRWEKLRRIATDIKLQRITQFVEAIRHLRWYGWQEKWLARIMDARQRELNLRIATALWTILITTVNSLASEMFPVAAFYAYTVWEQQPLRIDIAFPALQLFVILESNLREIPGLITTLLNASVAMGRIEDFMQEPNKDDTAEGFGTTTSDGSLQVSAGFNTKLEMENASFAWPGSLAPVLRDVSISLSAGLTIVCGEVAAGKTALLQAVLGELDKLEGDFVRPHEIMAYCAQTPWLESMSIRNNILFCSPYEPIRYNQVLQACALDTDMLSFAHGDLSNVGENGVGLSGGQKARVALARALYSKAKILLLDDPLSALDQQTAELIVRKCFGSQLLDGRTVLLVTHRTELCHGYAEQVLEVADGRVRDLDLQSLATSSIHQVTSHDSAVEDNNWKDEEDQGEPEKFMEDERRAEGGVKLAIYWEYIKAGKVGWWIALICFIFLYRMADLAGIWFLKAWGEAYSRPTGAATSGFLDRLPSPEVDVRPWLIGFLILGVAQTVAYAIPHGVMLVITYTAGRKMFIDIMTCVTHATFRFYDVTPVGRLMNRLTGDIGTTDGNIANLFQDVARLSISWLFSIVVIGTVTPVFLVFAVALTVAFVLIFARFLPTSQSLRRLEMVSLSPLMSNFGALLEGLVTVRAFCAQHHFQNRIIAVTDEFQRMDHFYWTLQTWLMYRLDALSAASTFILTLLAIYTNVSPGLTAFVLTAATRFVNSTHALCRQYGRLQMDFVSVERVVELLQLEQEPPGNLTPPAWWPSTTGNVVFENVTIRYTPTSDPALSSISLTIPGGSNTVIVGRTGSGKSTLALSLLATTLPTSGRILIDNIDITQINKSILRTRVTFLAQEPVLFPGSMRQNLDPQTEHTDAECSSVLSKIAGRHSWTLDTEIDTGGKNLSQGQRQLVGLARALLRRSAIVIFDEATASIDQETAVRIQQIMREEMRGSTVITIAHRVEAVRNADYCVRLAKGKLVEHGPAGEMLGSE